MYEEGRIQGYEDTYQELKLCGGITWAEEYAKEYNEEWTEEYDEDEYE